MDTSVLAVGGFFIIFVCSILWATQSWKGSRDSNIGEDELS